MTRTIRNLLLLVFIGLSGSSFAQEIAGKVVDEKKMELINAVIQVYSGGINKGGTVTDYEGNFSIKPLEPGYYNVLVTMLGYDSTMIRDAVVTPGSRTTLNFTLTRSTNVLKEFKVIDYKKPLVDKDKPGQVVLTKEEIKTVPTTQVTDLVSLAPGQYQSKRGGDVNMSGARTSGTLYIIDGVQVRGTTGVNMSQGSIDQLEVITSGIPANYGDVSGGVVNITTRGSASKLTGGFRAQQSIDGYNNRLLSFSLAGPIFKKADKNDSTRKIPVLGFSLSGDYYNDPSRYPPYNKQLVTKPEVMEELKRNPLRIVTDNSGLPVYNYSSNYVTRNDMVESKVPPNNKIQEVRLNGKMDYQVGNNMNITGGGNFSYIKEDAYSRARNLFNPEATPVDNTLSGRGFLRFTQKFGKSNDTTKSLISNAYYKVQIDYQRLYTQRQDPNFKENIFDYAYIGKFNETRRDIYGQTTDSISGKTGVVLLGSTATGVTYNRSEVNPGLANYTSQYYNSLNGVNPLSINNIQGNNGLANGDQPKLTYGNYLSPGATLGGFSRFNSDQYALSVDASFDLQAGKTKHSIEFGLYYQQRIEKRYIAEMNPGGTGTYSIWQQMRQLVSSKNSPNLVLDKANPLFKVNGETYTLNQIQNGVTQPDGSTKYVIPGPTDTIFYNYKNIGTSAFDKNLRKKLEIGANEDIFIDGIDRSKLSLDLFSADELLASGNPFVTYYGYSYTGQAQTGTVNFNDFWTAKDENGNYTRPIGAFSPNYIAGYILDKFTFKDVRFNVGLRVERYSANTKVLRDPFSLYAAKSVSQVSGTANSYNGGKHPENMGSGYVVYVDDNNSSSPTITGYRNGFNWYDPTGKFIEDPRVLKQFSGGRDPQPYLVDATTRISDTNFNPNLSFTDYTPQVNLLPRVNFSFPISESANFYAHYDIYAQRPTSNSVATAFDYYYLQQNANSIINNPNLKPQKTFDYEIGFQQKLNDKSALTITASYKERKDMITVVPYVYAWPSTYYSYGNRDFSTTKNTTFLYDLRATNHLRMNIAYTLQFSEGTGSGPNSSSGSTSQAGRGLLGDLVTAGIPNLRYITANDFDSRHIIAGNIDYRFNNGEGPKIGSTPILQNAGANLIVRTRSGEPYTRYSAAVGSTVIGGVNGSRLPWHFGMDLRVNKDFALTFRNKATNGVEGIKPKIKRYVSAILMVNNLLNTREVMSVYGYTGRPDDDGYITSPFGKQFVPQQVDPQAFTDQYLNLRNDPNRLNYARTMSLALEFNF